MNHKQLIHLCSTAGLFRLFRFFFQSLRFMQIVSGNHEKFGRKIINSFFEKIAESPM